MTRALGLLVLAVAASAGPARHIRYAESSNRMIYAFVFGSKDTCRVIRRGQAPRSTLEEIMRRPPGADERGGAGETLLVAFSFGRQGRPVHIVPTNNGRYLLTFANRALEGGLPDQDRIWHLKEKNYAERIDYASMPRVAPPAWPAVPRALKGKKRRSKKTEPPIGVSYGFLARETSQGHVLIGRQTEGPGDLRSEFLCFLIQVPDTDAVRPPDAL